MNLHVVNIPTASEFATGNPKFSGPVQHRIYPLTVQETLSFPSPCRRGVRGEVKLPPLCSAERGPGGEVVGAIRDLSRAEPRESPSPFPYREGGLRGLGFPSPCRACPEHSRGGGVRGEVVFSPTFPAEERYFL